jgi:thiamine-monophosphate kinase
MGGRLNEFGLIQQIQQQTSVSAPGVKLGIGDDAAVLEVPAGKHLVAATDTLNTGVHFPVDTSPFDIAYKCLAVNLSDLAAMGATPRWALLSLSLPNADAAWLESFTAGFKSLAQAYGVALVGGDTTSGPLSVSITALGLIDEGRGLLRSGAQPGDLVVVSGTVGGAARVLDLSGDDLTISDQHLLDQPQPRVRLGQALVGSANACIDISDGLLADLGHLLKASDCAARLELKALPAPEILADLGDEQRWTYQLAGGDDYELLFTLPKTLQDQLETWSKELDITLSVIGTIEEGEGIRCIAPDGTEFKPRKTGFDHFGATV